MSGPTSRESIRQGADYDPIDRHRFPADPWRLVETYPSTGDLDVARQ